ncbi:MAG: hypothetical protein O6930_07835 [Gammaproteobacteria bacterium]|nr:hypothetical protein [Gammaproteobacteria bacterium]
MRRTPSSIILIACLSLLALQLSGLHTHIDAYGYVGTPQGTHVHGPGIIHSDGKRTHLDGTGIDGHEQSGETDYAGDKDVSIVKLNTGATKLLMLVVWIGLTLLIVIRQGDKISTNFAVPPPTGRHVRWRPPLRAPPRFSQAPSH